MPVDLAGAVAVVTGAGRGIGRATALALAAAGSRVAAVDLDGDAAERTAAACGTRTGGARAYSCDVADDGALAATAQAVENGLGAVDVVVANAGVGLSGRFLDMAPDDWTWIRSVNLDGVVHCAQRFGPGMVSRRRGHLVVMSSMLGYTPHAPEAAYAATKAAALVLARSLRAGWRPHGVGVSAVCPGLIDTGIVEDTRFVGGDAPGRRANAARLFRRGHPPEKVAAAVLDAVRRDRAVVPVGWEARVAWWLHRLAPLRAQQFLAAP